MRIPQPMRHWDSRQGVPHGRDAACSAGQGRAQKRFRMRETLTLRAFLALLLDGLLERLVVYHVLTPLRHA